MFKGEGKYENGLRLEYGISDKVRWRRIFNKPWEIATMKHPPLIRFKLLKKTLKENTHKCNFINLSKSCSLQTKWGVAYIGLGWGN